MIVFGIKPLWNQTSEVTRVSWNQTSEVFKTSEVFNSR